ncbi:MAG: tetratricopeptide repeat protein [Acidobacteria bacterium]|nr:tetratricopeptide repeat protein [Acidobacteriota bacterium]
MKTSTIPVSLLTVGILFILSLSLSVRSQTADVKQMRERALALAASSNYIDALPLLQKVATATPSDPVVKRELGFALIANSAIALSQEEARSLRIRARKAFGDAIAAGDKSAHTAGMFNSLPADGGGFDKFSTNPKANEAMNRGETAFVLNNMDEALSYYQEALSYDPTNYFAVLFIGDVYKVKKDHTNAEIWYQKAIALNPYREIAYRYSATPLMADKKFDAARDRYVEAWITEPYNRLALSGIVRWAEAVGANLGHPRIDRPKTTVGADGKESTTITLDSLMKGGSQMAWITYTATRSIWKKEKFAKEFPDEKVYRHSMKEEVDALRSVVSAAKGFEKDPKKIDPQIQMIKKLDDEGLLEAYVLMTASDEGVASDHPKYLREHRDKLRDYVKKYVIREKN